MQVLPSDAGADARVVDDAHVSRCTPGGEPIRLTTSGAWALALDVDSVYFTRGGTPRGGAARVAKNGGAELELLGAGTAWGVAVDGQRVYVSHTALGTIEAAGIAGGALTTLASMQVAPRGIATDQDWVYWGGDDETVRRASKDGKSVELLATGAGKALSIVVAFNRVNWAAGSSGALSMPLTGGVPGSLAPLDSDLGFVWDISLEGTQLYVAAQGKAKGHIVEILHGGGPSRHLVDGLTYPVAVAADEDFAYFVDRVDRTVSKVPKRGGGPAITLARMPGLPWDIAVDESCLYVTVDDPNGAVYRLPKN